MTGERERGRGGEKWERGGDRYGGEKGGMSAGREG